MRSGFGVMKWEDRFIKDHMSADYCLLSVHVIQNVSLLVLWITKKNSWCGFCIKLVSGVFVDMCLTTYNSEVFKVWFCVIKDFIWTFVAQNP